MSLLQNKYCLHLNIDEIMVNFLL